MLIDTLTNGARIDDNQILNSYLQDVIHNNVVIIRKLFFIFQTNLKNLTTETCRPAKNGLQCEPHRSKQPFKVLFLHNVIERLAVIFIVSEICLIFHYDNALLKLKWMFLQDIYVPEFLLPNGQQRISLFIKVIAISISNSWIFCALFLIISSILLIHASTVLFARG